MGVFWAATTKIMYTIAPFDWEARKAWFIVENYLSGNKSQSQSVLVHISCHNLCGGSGNFISR